MNKSICFLLLLFPVVAISQPGRYKSSPIEYMWKNVGNAGFTEGVANFTSLAFSIGDQPYVAFQNGANGEKAAVMRFNEGAWESVGGDGISAARDVHSATPN